MIQVRSAGPRRPGELQITRSMPNPAGNIDEMFVLQGDVHSQAMTKIVALSQDDVPPRQDGAAKAQTLQVFHFNDFHNHFCDHDPEKGDAHRFSQMVQRINQARKTANDTEALLFLSAGDDHTGTVFDELLGWNVDEFVLDATYRLYSAGGLDLAAIGNHEFDRGSELLAHGIRRDAKFPLLSANVHSSHHLSAGEDYYPALIAVIKGLRVGIVGLTTHVETRVGQPSDLGLAVASPLKALENILPALADISDVVILLSHCGYGNGTHASGKAVVSRDLGEADFSIAKTAAKLTSKPMVLIGGHTHTRLNETTIDPGNIIDGVLLTQAECNGRFLGEVTLDLSSETHLKSARLHLIKDQTDETPDDYDQAFEATHVQPIHKLIEKNLDGVIGRVESPHLERDITLATRYLGETPLANFMTDALVARLQEAGEDKPNLSFLNAASILTGLAPGPLTFRQWFDVMPYSDEIFLMSITGRQIEDMLHSNAKRILRPEERETIDPGGFVARGFLHASKELTYRINLGAHAGEATAEDIQLMGQPISENYDRTLQVAMTTYLALGSFGERWNGKSIAGGVPGDLAGYDIRPFPNFNTNLVYRSELIQFIRDIDVISEATGARLDGRLQIN